MKNLKLNFAHFSILATVVFSMFMASCEDNPVEINLTCAEIQTWVHGMVSLPMPMGV